MATLNYTTKVAASRTIAEIQALLAQHGADAVATNYENKRACGLSFKLSTPHGPRAFTLPVDIEAVHRLLVQQRKDRILDRDAHATPEHAERVAWRVLKDWLAAQLAIIEAQMATLDQVMLPYLHIDGDRTLYEAYAERESAMGALTAGAA